MFKIIFGVALIVYLKRLSGKGCNRELWLQQYIGFPLLILQHRPVVCETGCCGRAAVLCMALCTQLILLFLPKIIIIKTALINQLQPGSCDICG